MKAEQAKKVADQALEQLAEALAKGRSEELTRYLSMLAVTTRVPRRDAGATRRKRHAGMEKGTGVFFLTSVTGPCYSFDIIRPSLYRLTPC